MTSGGIEIKLKWGIIPIDQKEDLCDILKQSGQACPLQAGNHTLTLSQSIPSEAPGVSWSQPACGDTCTSNGTNSQ